jgi:hypothetical protein|nr:MG2 domain-containing protein [Kofleriaceae bacterium]
MTRQLRLFILGGVAMAGGLAYGIHACGRWPAHDGNLRQTADVHISNARRTATANVAIDVEAHYTTHDSDDVRTLRLTSVDHVAMTLVDAKKHATPLDVDWAKDTRGTFVVPDVPDGDYTVHVELDSDLGHDAVDVPLPLYAPARVHVITDRPLYEPGNTMQFRAVALRARDLTPLDGRPGKWLVIDPHGEVQLEDKAPAGDWGVVSGSFPLDRGAETGTWHVIWDSNGARDDVAVTVEPFTLPRFRVEVNTDKTFYQSGDTPKLRGVVAYSSGAPVGSADVAIDWTIDGAWPPPTDWQDHLLPKHATTAANGRFELALPTIPADLQGRATLVAHVSAVDPAGDRVATTASVLLSEDAIGATSVTELGDGLVDGFNNRMYVRVTTADGRVVPDATIHVKRAWQPSDPGITAKLDADGVAALQIDPGAPVNIVIPPLPWRPAPHVNPVSRTNALDLVSAQNATLADQLEMDGWLASLEPCAKLTDGGQDARVGLRVDAAGAITTATGGPAALDRCLAGTLASRRLPAGGERMYALTFHVADPELPRVTPELETALDAPAGLAEQLAGLAHGARDCVPLDADGELPVALTWRATEGSKDVALVAWVHDPRGAATAASAVACVESRLGPASRVHLAEAASSDSLGVVKLTVQPPASLQQDRPQATTMLGYELAITADLPNAPAGAPTASTKLRVTPGTVPPVRLRVDPVLAQPGDTVAAQLIRGPEFTGTLPKKLHYACLTKQDDVDLDDEHHAQVTIPAGVAGWCEVTGAGARALVYVKPAGELAVTIAPEHPTYAPGQMAQLQVHTTVGGQGGRAAVGLFGVDQSLGQLVPLPGAEDLGRVQPKVETSRAAFGVLDGQALALGRVRGANAAAATVLRVSAIPPPPELDALVEAHASTTFDAVGELTDHFYTALAELHAQARRWEATAPASEKMSPATMVSLWNAALDACEQRGETVTDAFGRRLRLSLLPVDLLALTDPRAVVVVGTRLPEDVDNWAAYVAKEKP